jgi:hypothetical protein
MCSAGVLARVIYTVLVSCARMADVLRIISIGTVWCIGLNMDGLE